MPEAGVQFDSLYPNYFMKLFDDIFTTREEQIFPLHKVTKCKNRKERTAKRLRCVENWKRKNAENVANKLNKARDKSEKEHYLEMAVEVYLAAGNGNETDVKVDADGRPIDPRVAKAFNPMNVHIPNFDLCRTMYEWGLGGPTSRQYTLLAHIVDLHRELAKGYYSGMISAYLALREDWRVFVGPHELDLLKPYSFNKPEEDIIVNLFLPKDPKQVSNDAKHYSDGPSLGPVFLELDFVTKRNIVFKAFVKRAMVLDPQIRENLASKYLHARMFQLNADFITTGETKYNYIRIAWERKSHFMDDYLVCLILFLRDKTSNITWDELEELIYPKAKELIRASFKVSWDSAYQQWLDSVNPAPVR